MRPQVFYKYREDSSRTGEIITKGMVWLATAEGLNDPLECRTGKIPDEWKRKSIREMENAQMGGFVMSAMPALKGKQSFYSLSPRATKRWFQGLKRLKTRKEKYAKIRSFLKDHGRDISRPAELFEKFENQLSQAGIFSLSECPDVGALCVQPHRARARFQGRSGQQVGISRAHDASRLCQGKTDIQGRVHQSGFYDYGTRRGASVRTKNRF